MPDLAELYARDPLSLTRDDLDVIILDLRAKREQFQLGDKAVGKAPKAKPDGPPPVLNLVALGLKKPSA